MIEVSVDQAERVFVRWHGGGPWLVLDRDGSVSTEATALAAEPWREEPDDTFDEDDYEAGWHDGVEAAAEAASDAVHAARPPSRRCKPAPKPTPARIAAAAGGKS